MAFSAEDRQLIGTLAAQHGISKGAVEELWRAVQAGNGTAAQFNHSELGGMGQWMAGGMVMVGDFSKTHLQSTVMQICTAIANHLQGQRMSSQAQAASGSWQHQSQSQQPASTAGHNATPHKTGATPANEPKRGGFLSSVGKLFGGGKETTAHSSATGNTQAEAAGWSNWWPDALGSPNSSGSQNNMHYAYFAGTRRLALRLGNRVTIYDTGDHQIGGVSQQQGSSRTVTFRSQKGEIALNQLKKVAEYQV